LEPQGPALRVATLADETALDALMRESASVLFPRFYDERQAASAVRFVAKIDRTLLADGTYPCVSMEKPIEG
jgi:hypothetical protein